MAEKSNAGADAPETASEGAPRRKFTRTEKLLCWLLVLAGFYTMFFARDVLVPITIALVAGIILSPIVRWLARLKIPDSAGAGLVVISLVAVFIGLGSLVGPAVETWVNRWPAVSAEIQDKLYPVKRSVEKAKKVTEGIEKMAEPGKPKPKAVVQGPSLAEKLYGRATDTLLLIAVTLVLAFFVLARSRRIMKNILLSAPEGTSRKRWACIAGDVQHDVAVYMLTITVINAGLGLVVAIVMYALGMPNPLLWGVLAALLNYLPYLGPMVMLGIVSLVSLLTFDALPQIILPPLAYLAMTAIEGQFMTPIVVGRQMIMNPLAIFISVLFWGMIWGVAGVLLAVPILATLRVLAEHADSLAFLRPLLR